MTIPGFRPCTATDLREGVEVLIPMVIDPESGDAVTLATDAGHCGVAWRSTLPGLALIRDERAEGEVASMEAELHDLRHVKMENERLRSALRIAVGGELPETVALHEWESHVLAARAMLESWRKGWTERGDLLATAIRERDEARANVSTEDVAQLRAGLIAESERADRAEAWCDRQRAEIERLRSSSSARLIAETDGVSAELAEQDKEIADLRAQLTAAERRALDTSVLYGGLLEAVHHAGLLRGLDLPDAVDTLAALLDRARGGGR